MKGEHYHFLGIGGIGMSALAFILLERGATVSGEDKNLDVDLIQKLRERGATVHGHGESSWTQETSIVYSTAISKDHPALKGENCKLHRSDLLNKLTVGKKSLYVTGTHGKTTTTSLLAHVLQSAGLAPAFVVGGIVHSENINGKDGKGEYFVLEADESDGSLLKGAPFGAIVTNIDSDHLDYWENREKLENGFSQFGENVKSGKHFFWCGDDASLRSLFEGRKGLSYGFSEGVDIQATHVRSNGWSMSFDIIVKGEVFKDFTLNLIGHHNVLNALGVFGLARSLGVEVDAIRFAFALFGGVGRRAENVGTCKSISIIDDYGHHHTEIAVTLGSIQRAVEGRRIIAVYQPHRYTRTRDTIEEIGGAFASADIVIVTDIYASGQQPIEGITGALVASRVAHYSTCHYCPEDQLLQGVMEVLRPHDVVVTVGAGSITDFGRKLYKHLETHAPKKYRLAVLCGGVSSEGPISLLSTDQIVQRISHDYYDLEKIGIMPDGRWFSSEDPTGEIRKHIGKNLGMPSGFAPEILEKLCECDVVFPIMHGAYGEDGTLQGMLEMLGLPYVGSDSRASALCMDKELTKCVVASYGVPVLPFLAFKHTQWNLDSEACIAQVEKTFSYPVVAKPAHGGSSLGVGLAANRKELQNHIDAIIRIDTKILVEPLHEGRELQFAILGNDNPTCFHPGEIANEGVFVDYHKKYNAKFFPRLPKAMLPEEVALEGRAIAKKAYEALGCSGLCRIDMFLSPEGKWELNEANPIPGFTANSLYPKIICESGISYNQLIDKLIIYALDKWRTHAKKIKSTLTFNP